MADDDRWALAHELAEVGRAVRAAVGSPGGAADAEVVRSAGGDDVFGVDERADVVLVAELDRRCGRRWPGRLVLEGYDDEVTVGAGGGPWRYLADPVDGSRPWLWGKRSAWVLLGAGLEAATLADLDVGACIELPTPAAGRAVTAWAVTGAGAGAPRVELDDVGGSGLPARSAVLDPLAGGRLDHRFVTVMRYAVGTKAVLGAWEDQVLAGLHTYEDPYLSTGGLLMEIALGRQAAAFDPRSLLIAGAMSSHPYDLAGWVVPAAAGVIVESLPSGPLAGPLDTMTSVPWAAYANEEIAAVLRPRVAAALP